MASPGDRRRLKLFNQYSPNLALWEAELQGKYACPICLRYDFDEQSVFAPNPRLTEEHCIQRGLGKNLTVLTCAKCNNTAGRTVDCHLHKRMDFSDFWNGTLGEPFDAEITVAGHTVSIKLRKEPGKMDMHIQEKVSDPKAIEALQQLMKGGPPPDGFKLHLGPKHTPDTKRSRIAVLKSAYLLLFRHFGYGYIFSPNLNSVREQILDPKSKVVPLDCITFNTPLDRLPNTIMLINKPDGLGGIAVPVPLAKRDFGYLVIMPSETSTFDRWEAFAEGRDKTKLIDFSGDLLPFDETLLTEKPFNWNTHDDPEPED